VLGSSLPPVTVATALLFYFGWARAQEEARELGIDISVLGMSTQDYLLASISSLYLPLLVAGAAGLLAVMAHRYVMGQVAAGDRPRSVSRYVGVGLCLAVALPVLGWIFEVVTQGWEGLVFPLALTVALLLLLWALAIRAAVRGERGGLHSSGVVHLLVGTLVTAALFWELSSFSLVVGRGLADRITSCGGLLPVQLYARSDLQITAPGVTSEYFDGDRSAYRVVYRGLKFLQRSGDKIFLIPYGWSASDKVVLVVRDDADVRLEFGAGQAPPDPACSGNAAARLSAVVDVADGTSYGRRGFDDRQA
jgi:hypothetical protein